jgi:hypothetical protein
MKLENQDWNRNKEASVAKIVRAISQDVGKNFRDKTLRLLFPKKIIKDEETGQDIDIGLKCCEWLYKLLTEFEPSKKQWECLAYNIRISYDGGYDFEKNEAFQKYITFYLAPTFKKKLDKFSQISKLSFMDDLDRKSKSAKSLKGDEIQW